MKAQKEAKPGLGKRLSKSYLSVGGIFQIILMIAIPMISLSCSSWLVSKSFTLDIETEGKQEARIVVAPVTLAEGERVVDTTGGIHTEGGLGLMGSYDQTDADTLIKSLQKTIDLSQLESLRSDAPEWHLCTIVRSSMETFTATSGMRNAINCIAWCLADEANNVLYHEQFFVYNKTRLFRTVGSFKTSRNKFIVYRIARRALILATNPDSIDLHDSDDPNTYDHFLELKKELPHLEVWKNIEYAGKEYKGSGIYSVYRVSGRAPGWEAVEPLDDIDWKSYIASQDAKKDKQ